MYRPLQKIESNVRNKFENEIYSKFKIGTYKEKKQIKEILQSGFSFYENILEHYLKKSASIDMLAFILSEYDKYVDLSIEFKKGTLSKSNLSFWNEYGTKSKRGLKFLAEKIVLHLPNDNKENKNINIHESLSYCWIAAEEMISLYASSHVGYSLFPDDCYIIIKEKGGYDFIEFQCDKFTKAYNNLNMHDFLKNQELSNTLPFEPNIQNKYLGDAFKKNLNIDYLNSVAILQYLIECFQTDDSASIKSFHFKKNPMINALASDYGIDHTVVSNIINGFLLSKENLVNRILYKPKQEYRAFRRAFFEVETEDGLIILFSKKMALEEFSQMIRSVCFKKLPSEWLSLDKEINKSLAKFSNYTGTWFEEFLISCLKEKGIKCIRSLSKLKIDGKNEYIPESVGDIDIVALVGNKLHIIECKMVQFASEPTGYIDDMDKFITNKNSYKSKFIKKINWANNNIVKIKQHLKTQGINFSDDIEIKPYMVTYYPTIAAEFIEEFSCLDITKYIKTSL
ncbi:hypothetical protein [Photobacterium damselae]|uniref:hypothetical protein n=1 Tax=Photobacterium damselae TaxID=38293 RepID=UPI0025431112